MCVECGWLWSDEDENEQWRILYVEVGEREPGTGKRQDISVLVEV